MGNYIVHKNGEQLGPFTAKELSQQLTAGILLPGDMAWDKTRGAWVPIGQLSAAPVAPANTRLALIAIVLGLVLAGGGALIGWAGLQIIAGIRDFEEERVAMEEREPGEFGVEENINDDFGWNHQPKAPIDRGGLRPIPVRRSVPIGNGGKAAWENRPAENGDANTQFENGVSHAFGRDVAVNEDEAIKYYRRAAAQGHRMAMNNLAYTYACRDERLPEALELIERAMKDQPASSVLLDTHGWVLFKMGKYDRSLKSLQDAIRLKPEWVSLDHIGDCHLKLNEPAKARLAWRGAIVMLKMPGAEDQLEQAARILRKINGLAEPERP